MDFIHGLLHGLSLTDQNTGPAVTAVHAGAGNDQVPDSGQATERLKGPAHADTKLCDLVNPPGNQRSLCIISITQSICNARCQSNDIFQRSA